MEIRLKYKPHIFWLVIKQIFKNLDNLSWRNYKMIVTESPVHQLVGLVYLLAGTFKVYRNVKHTFNIIISLAQYLQCQMSTIYHQNLVKSNRPLCFALTPRRTVTVDCHIYTAHPFDWAWLTLLGATIKSTAVRGELPEMERFSKMCNTAQTK